MDNFTIEVEAHELTVSLAALTVTGAKPPIVFLHGFGSTKEDYADAAFPGRLTERSIIAFDLPGCGESRCSNLPALNIASMRDILDEALRARGVEQFHLAGHSLGGLIGLLLAEKRGQDILSFTSIEGNLAQSDCFFSRQILTHPGTGACAFMQGLQERTRKEDVYSYSLYATSLTHKVYAEAAPPIFRSMMETCSQHNLLEMFLGLSCPSMFLYGDVNSSLPYLEALSDNDVCLAEIPESGHFPMYSNPPAMWAALTKFIDNVDTGALSDYE